MILPFWSKLAAAQLNSSKDKGSVSTSVDFNGVVVVGLAVSMLSRGTNIGGNISSSDGVCGSWETAVEVTIFLF